VLFLVFCVVQDIALNYGLQGQESGFLVKNLPNLVRSTALDAFERTHGRVQHHGRTQPAAARTHAPSTMDARSTTVARSSRP
jgi:hypothetical protein